MALKNKFSGCFHYYSPICFVKENQISIWHLTWDFTWHSQRLKLWGTRPLTVTQSRFHHPLHVFNPKFTIYHSNSQIKWHLEIHYSYMGKVGVRKSESALRQQLGPAALAKPGDSSHGQASRLWEYFLEEKWKEFKNKPKTCFYLSCTLLKARLWQTDRQKLVSCMAREDSPQSQVVLHKFWILTVNQIFGLQILFPFTLVTHFICCSVFELEVFLFVHFRFWCLCFVLFVQNL